MHPHAMGRTDHVPKTVTILTHVELQNLARQHTTNRARTDLHGEARNWLNRIANGHYGDQNIIDLTRIWERWSAWLATQREATQSFEFDVAAFTAEAIENTRDPNRGGRPRVDFCVYLVDGSYWRFHPGTTMQSSSQTIHIPAILPDTTRGAADHAAIQWSTLGQSNVWTITRSALVPQTDRMGKQAV